MNKATISADIVSSTSLNVEQRLELEKEISEILNKSRSTINQHSKATGWYAIESAVKTFEKTIH